MSIQAVRTQIRFALEQLKPQNKHHGFEDIAREFARQRICRNLLPATGPVGAGGDQGRDFETFKTYLDSPIENTVMFEGVSKQEHIFFACSLQEKIVAKIRSDVKSIFTQTDERRPIFYFCVEDVPVSKRNQLINWCNDNYGVELQIFDGLALSENLSDPDIFWIAEEFLHIPADIYPHQNTDDTYYKEYKERWIKPHAKPLNVSDFCQIKYGLREATYEENLRIDLPGWIVAMRKLLEGANDFMKRKVQYEICVAGLRGQKNLTQYKDIVEDYFADMDNISNPLDLTDICILLSFCSTGKLIGEFDVDSEYLHERSQRLMSRIDFFLKADICDTTRCVLIEAKARAYLLQYYKGIEPQFDLDSAFKWWKKLVSYIDKAPLFPLEQFSDTMVLLTSMIGDDERFLDITDKLDCLLAKRFGGHAAADKCRNRAMAFYDNGKIIQAIEHLHRVKINWFSAEALGGTIVTSRFIAQCYAELGMKYAAKYYALSSFILAFRSNQEDLNSLISKCVFQTAEVTYGAGDWFSYFSIMRLGLFTHHQFDDNSLDLIEHDSLQRAIYYSVVIRTLSKRFWPDIYKYVEECFGSFLIDDEMRSELKHLTDSLPNNAYWRSAPFEDILSQIEENLAGSPFADTGTERVVSWRALGITWEVRFDNSYEITRIAEEFVAVLQIALVDLAQFDFQLLPLKIEINASLSIDDRFHVKEKPDNEKLIWDISIPIFKPRNRSDIEKRTNEVFAYTVSALAYCSMLSYDSFHSKLKTAMKKGLTNKTFFGRPYPELYSEMITADEFNEALRKKFVVKEVGRSLNHPEHTQLSWVTTPGANYSEEDAREHAKNRYERLSGMMEVIWPKIIMSEPHKEFFERLHNDGYLDWHISLIACNVVSNYIVQVELGLNPKNKESATLMQKTTYSLFDGEMDHLLNSFNIERTPISDFEMQRKISFLTIMKTWRIGPTRPLETPNFDAVKKFLIARYKIFEVDAPHKPLFTS